MMDGIENSFNSTLKGQKSLKSLISNDNGWKVYITFSICSDDLVALSDRMEYRAASTFLCAIKSLKAIPFLYHSCSGVGIPEASQVSKTSVPISATLSWRKLIKYGLAVIRRLNFLGLAILPNAS